jgi:hypothetical protein
MTVILWAFSLFHLFVSMACLAVAVRLLTPEERALWRSPLALLAAELMCWIYPIAAFIGVRAAWDAFEAAQLHAIPMILAPILWLVLMGIVYAIVDFADDGIIGNARARD